MVAKRNKEARVVSIKTIFLLRIIIYMCQEKNRGTQISSVPINANTSPTGAHIAPIIPKGFFKLKEAHKPQPIAKTPIIIIAILMTINTFSMKYMAGFKLSTVRKQHKGKAVSDLSVHYIHLNITIQ
tara:strand:+ start:358 stop:738 length:381 start_codon:yes stop_codon:yes gene_type:complete